MNFMEVMAVYNGSNGDETVAMYRRLETLGPAGVVAMNLFRATKASARAKVYRGGNGRGSYRGQAYEKKDWSIGQLCAAMTAHGEALGIAWGWGRDEGAIGFEDVLYVDLPEGQVSFHCRSRKDGPDYPGEWDQVRKAGPTRICKHVSALLAPMPVARIKETAE
ncbi:MAG: hypothetical protein KGL39_40460 [Patescibacteria group bacterium]|nr:hypothetical protein [Patescibacteria group bacterium]